MRSRGSRLVRYAVNPPEILSILDGCMPSPVLVEGAAGSPVSVYVTQVTAGTDIGISSTLEPHHPDGFREGRYASATTDSNRDFRKSAR